MDVHLRRVAEPHRPAHVAVDVGEELAASSHVVGRAAVEVPSVDRLLVGDDVEDRLGARLASWKTWS